MDTKDTHKEYTHRYLARIVLEAETPLAVGSGEKDIRTDALVATDSNGLPYIPATSIAGVIRSMLIDTNTLFGYQDGDKGRGSEIIFTEAKVINSKGCVVDGMNQLAIDSDPLLQHYQLLPVRQHVRLDDKGTSANAGLFNEQVVFAGTRFCFEIEMVSDGKNFKEFETVLINLFDESFRIGGGTRSGFGKIKVVSVQIKDLNLTTEDDLNLYLTKTSALDSNFWVNLPNLNADLSKQKAQRMGFSGYELTLTPESFFLFGSGFGDDEVDQIPVKAKCVKWDKEGNGKMQENLVLIPGSSVKGAIAHRVAYHWNRMNGVYADDLTAEGLANATGKNNMAVRILFGSEGNNKDLGISRGNVIFSDIIRKALPDKIFNHVAIDRFTGGAIEGALFNEKATYGGGQTYQTMIMLDRLCAERACRKELGKDAREEDVKKLLKKVVSAFEATIDDLCNGMLPLGGRVNKGYGVFTGEYKLIRKKDGDNK